MSELSYLEKLLDRAEVDWLPLEEVFDIFAGGDKPTDAFSDVETDEINVPILSNGIDKKSLYGWTNRAKINEPSLTVSARGTIGWTSYRDRPFFPIIRLLVLTPKTKVNLKYAYYYMKTIEKRYKVAESGIPQLTKPMIKDTLFPIPCPNNPEKSLAIQGEIVRILDAFTSLTTELTTELNMRKKQYNYYRNKLLTFQDGEVPHLPMGQYDVGTFIRGSSLQKKDFTETGVGCIHYGQVYTYYGTCAHKTKSFVSEEFAQKARKAQTGDLIIATTSENDEDVCKAVVWLGEGEIAISGDACFYKHNLNPKYVAYFFQTEQFEEQKRKYITGAKVKRVNADNLAKILIPVPPLAAQSRIVSILDKFDALTNSISKGLPREISLRKKQYEYYRDQLLSFPKSLKVGT